MLKKIKDFLLEKQCTVLQLITVAAALFIACILMMFTYFSTCKESMIKHLYPEVAMVIAINEETDCITVECANGNRFEFYNDKEDWMIGDLCGMIMHDQYTEIVYNDKIIKTEYAGYTDLFLNIEKQSKIK